MSTNEVPFTTRPRSTSRQGMTRLACTATEPLAEVEGGARLGHGELALVERRADDHAVEVHLAQPGEPFEVRQRADPAGVDEAAPDGRRDPSDLVEVRAG